MHTFSSSDHPHRRKNPLTGDWVLVSPHRAKRPWQGLTEEPAEGVLAPYDPDCYLCPGNTRINGAKNPTYSGPFVFTNDFAALQSEDFAFEDDDPLLQCESVAGTSRVICFSERHDLTLPTMDIESVGALIGVWCDQYEELNQIFEWVQVFENKGALNGCSNPHPHSQVWASSALPTLVEKEGEKMLQYFRSHGSNLLLDYALRERSLGERVVCENADWIAVVPWWASWPFEILLMPVRHVTVMTALTHRERNGLAAILKELTTRYDNLFQTSFPYSMGWHGAPGGENLEHWQLHAHFYPPLLRSASVRKFMVGYEMLCEPQRDLTPEQAASRLRDLSPIHYLEAD